MLTDDGSRKIMYDDRVVFCQGYRHNVRRSNAKFVSWGGVYCFFCNQCLSIIQQAAEKDKPIMTHEELIRHYKG